MKTNSFPEKFFAIWIRYYERIFVNRFRKFYEAIIKDVKQKRFAFNAGRVIANSFIYCPKCREVTPVICRRRLSVLAVFLFTALMPLVVGVFIFVYAYSPLFAFMVLAGIVFLLFTSEARACSKCRRFEKGFLSWLYED